MNDKKYRSNRKRISSDEYLIEDLSDERVFRPPKTSTSSCDGVPVTISKCLNCVIGCFNHHSTITVTNCFKCTFFLGPTSGRLLPLLLVRSRLLSHYNLSPTLVSMFMIVPIVTSSVQRCKFEPETVTTSSYLCYVQHSHRLSQVLVFNFVLSFFLTLIWKVRNFFPSSFLPSFSIHFILHHSLLSSLVQLQRAELSIFNNNWYQVFDFNASESEETNWTLVRGKVRFKNIFLVLFHPLSFFLFFLSLSLSFLLSLSFPLFLWMRISCFDQTQDFRFVMEERFKCLTSFSGFENSLDGKSCHLFQVPIIEGYIRSSQHDSCLVLFFLPSKGRIKESRTEGERNERERNERAEDKRTVGWEKDESAWGKVLQFTNQIQRTEEVRIRYDVQL